MFDETRGLHYLSASITNENRLSFDYQRRIAYKEIYELLTRVVERIESNFDCVFSSGGIKLGQISVSFIDDDSVVAEIRAD